MHKIYTTATLNNRVNVYRDTDWEQFICKPQHRDCCRWITAPEAQWNYTDDKLDAISTSNCMLAEAALSNHFFY